MFCRPILCVPRSEAIRYAAGYLSDIGFTITYKPAVDVGHILLPVPSFSAGDTYLAHVLKDLPEDVTISGGNLSSPLLRGYRTVDFLSDPYYLAENAAITASCAIQILKARKQSNLTNCHVLVVGWGRIGKCLCRLFDQEGATVTVTARKDADRAMAEALGCRSIGIEDAKQKGTHFDAIINTVPAMILPDIATNPDTIILELASSPGINGDHVIDARGLPGKMAPERSGELIAKTFIRLSLGKECEKWK